MRGAIHRTARTLAVALASSAALGLPAPVAGAAERPVKEIVSSHIGWEVDKTTGGKACTVVSGDECQPGKASGQPGGFEYPEGVASAPNGHVYVADRGNNRVQEFTATGELVLMFGRKVNKKGGNVCLKIEESECQAGEESSRPGEFGGERAIAIDSEGDIYVADLTIGSDLTIGWRIQKFTPEGQWVLEIGKEVNQTKVSEVKAKGGTPTQQELEEENLCTRAEEAKGTQCGAPAQRIVTAPTSPEEPGAFERINAIAAGGPEGRLYVGEQDRVQEFTKEGRPVSEPAGAISARLGQISPAAASRNVSALTVDSTGNIYVAYQVEFTTKVIRRFDPSGAETELPLSARTEGAQVSVQHIALDPSGRLAVVEAEISNHSPLLRGTLYEVGTMGLHPITGFVTESQMLGMGFSSTDDLVTVGSFPGQELTIYEPKPVGELLARGASCAEGPGHETNATLDCTLDGEVNPWGVPQTEAWFQWGSTAALGSETEMEPIATGETPVSVSASVESLTPNETYYYQVAGHDENVKAPELLTSERTSLTTPSVPPRIVGEASVSYVRFANAVMFGEVNPENTPTAYAFQYGACEGGLDACAETGLTQALVSNAYGPIATTLEASELQPATTYRYRLVAVNEHEQVGVGPEGTFTTMPAPVPQAATGAASAVTSTSAVVSGSVNPDGAQAIYTFELGVYNGAATRYGIVLTAPAGASSTPVEKTLALSGLQPGTSYAYRITVKSGYGQVTGATMLFTTQGLPAVLEVPAALGLLAVPDIKLPKAGGVGVRHAGRSHQKRKKHKHQAQRTRKHKPSKGKK
jgi:hypothetical protein